MAGKEGEPVVHKLALCGLVIDLIEVIILDE